MYPKVVAEELCPIRRCISAKEESYTSQCSPLSPEVGKRYAEPSNRKERGLYRDGNRVYNADAVGAYNILRKYHSVSGVKKELSVTGLKTPEIIK